MNVMSFHRVLHLFAGVLRMSRGHFPSDSMLFWPDCSVLFLDQYSLAHSLTFRASISKMFVEVMATVWCTTTDS